jgi:hypothetical protein
VFYREADRQKSVAEGDELIVINWHGTIAWPTLSLGSGWVLIRRFKAVTSAPMMSGHVVTQATTHIKLIAGSMVVGGFPMLPTL